MAAVAVLQFIYFCSGGNAKELVAKADTHDGLDGAAFCCAAAAFVHGLAQYVYGLLALGRVARAVTQEQSVIFQAGVILIPRNADYFKTA